MIFSFTVLLVASIAAMFVLGAKWSRAEATVRIKETAINDLKQRLEQAEGNAIKAIREFEEEAVRRKWGKLVAIGSGKTEFRWHDTPASFGKGPNNVLTFKSIKQTHGITLKLHSSDPEKELDIDLSEVREIVLGPPVDAMTPEPSRKVRIMFRDRSSKNSVVEGTSMAELINLAFSLEDKKS